ncbi:MAG TPA: cytochrome c peroxidase [Ramlibacter sp.]|uniref:cytochrome c peroxidase n=1 Tax=Ramlibacter sp. TaxID=1917967 RepID=UPI002D7F9F99|nr:cytochrome c peroxidase [Ramlibacter sp.]HET8747390.1 cytochrome c peroxidase [Ramlibacter sp.]
MLRTLALGAGLAALAACSAPPDLDLSLDKASAEGKYHVTLVPPETAPAINQMHSWQVKLATPGGKPVHGARFTVGGGMPQHGHGFPTQPRVEREIADGTYLLEGMKFSMPGWWEVKLAIQGAEGGDRVTFNAVVSRTAPAATTRVKWTSEEAGTIASMRLQQAGARPADPSNAYELRADAAALGRALFNDKRLSGNGEVACATCHASNRQFQDDRPVGQGVGTGQRRTMPVMGAAHSPFLFWDGRKDSLWSQALGPLEDPAEHGGNRARFARTVQAHYQAQYESVFGPLPSLAGLPADASPNGNDAQRAAWQAMPAAAREQVNRVFANMGKAIAAYERQVSYGESRFDRYAQAIASGSAPREPLLSAQEIRGLRLFLNEGQCVTCHNGPLLTDHAFHNTGVPPRDRSRPDAGRAEAIRKLQQDEFNCLGRYSDAKPGQCGELEFLATGDAAQLGAFRTPSLRNVAERAPYMHAGQFDSLEEALRHYARSPLAALGHSELARPGERHAERQAIRLSDADIRDLAAFLRTLSGPVLQPS